MALMPSERSCGRASARAGTAHRFIPPHRGAQATPTPSGHARPQNVSTAAARSVLERKAVATATALPIPPSRPEAQLLASRSSGDDGGAAAGFTADTDVELIARAAMEQMGKHYGSKQDELVDKLRDEMYDTAAAFSELSEDLLPGLAQQWRAPHRLLATMHRIAAAAATSAAPPSPPSPPQRLYPVPEHVQAEAASPSPAPSGQQHGGEASMATQGGSGRRAPSDAAAVPGAAEERPVGRGADGGGEKLDADPDEEDFSGVDDGDEVEETEEDEEEEDGADGDGGRRARGGELAAAGQGPDIRQIPIAERRCPSKFRFGHGSGRRVRLTERQLGEPYSLKASETPASLAAELTEFESFSLYGSFAGAQLGEPLRRTSYVGYLQCVRQALGWLHRVEGLPLGELRLEQLVPGTGRGAARRVHAFLMWQERERGMCKRSAARSLAALIQVAKFLYHEQSQVREGDKPYSDLEIIKSLRAMYMGYERATRVAGHAVDSSAKWIDWPDYLDYVGELRRECAALKSNGRPRSPVDVAMSLQAYLIAAILSCVPDRQRTLRELVVGRTLVKDKSGVWSIRHTHADYKTGGTYGERPPLVIDPGMYYELEEFINVWRAHLKPQHNFLFSKRDGSAPLNAQELSRSFSLNAFRLTGRKLNPHMVRDMVVTYARSGHASEHELEALAIYMGHSLAEQRGTYDRRTKAEKVQPAMGLLAKISGGAAGAAAAAHTGPASGAVAAAQHTAGRNAPAPAVTKGRSGGGGGASQAHVASAAAAEATGAAAGAVPSASSRKVVSRSRRAVPEAPSAPAAPAAAVATPAAPAAASATPSAPAVTQSVPPEAAISSIVGLSAEGLAQHTRTRRQARKESTDEGSGGGGAQRTQRRAKGADALVAAADPAL